MQILEGQEYRVKYPFYFCIHHRYDENGLYQDEVWIPGTRSQHVEPDDSEAIADGEGEMILRVVSIHKPGRFPTRVFYTRKYVDPDGKEFGSGKLHMTTTQTFRRRASAFYYEYRVL